MAPSTLRVKTVKAVPHASPTPTDHNMSHTSTETGGHGALLSVTCAAVPCTPEDLSDSGVPFGCVARPRM